MSHSNDGRLSYIQRFDLKKGILELVLILIVLGFLYPFYTVISMALKTAQEAITAPLSFPKTLYFKNFVTVWRLMNFQSVFINSVFLTGLSLGGLVIFAGMCAFAIVRMNNKMYKTLYYIFISGIMIPFYMTLSPLIKLMKDLGFMNSIIGVALAYMGRGLPFAIFLYVGFIRGIPNEIMESAVIDGCPVAKLYWKIVFPIMKPVTATLIILDALWIWNDFLFPLLTLTQETNRTIPLSQYRFYGMYSTQYELAFSAYLIGMLPLIVLYIFLQKHIIKGIVAGAVKG
jgi:raffinose/stachyose/melibiose transport system permease protein